MYAAVPAMLAFLHRFLSLLLFLFSLSVSFLFLSFPPLLSWIAIHRQPGSQSAGRCSTGAVAERLEADSQT